MVGLFFQATRRRHDTPAIQPDRASAPAADSPAFATANRYHAESPAGDWTHKELPYQPDCGCCWASLLTSSTRLQLTDTISVLPFRWPLRKLLRR